MGTPLRQHCVLPPPLTGEDDSGTSAVRGRGRSGGEFGDGPGSGFGDDGVFIVAQGA